MKYKYLLIDANNLGYRVMNNHLDRSLLRVSNKFIYKNFVKHYIDTVEMLKKLYESEQVILLFDNHNSKEELKKSFQVNAGSTRKNIKETYKANRKRETTEFYESLNFIKYYYMIGEASYHTVQVFKLEADDLVAPCIQTVVKNDTALMITNDSDWTRYLNDKIHYLPDTYGNPYDKNTFYSQYGFYPTEDKVILYKILFGDNADHIPVLFPEIPKNIRKKLIDDFESIFDVILNTAKVDYMKDYLILLKEREIDIKINYQLICALPVTNKQFLSHYTEGRGSDKLRNVVRELIFDEKKENKSFEFGGIKVPRVVPK